MTEEEAKTKWCPFTRAVTGNRERGALINRLEPHNRVGIPGEPSPQFTVVHQCIGSACMAWRWASERNPDWNPNTGAQWPSPHPSTNPAYRQSSTEGGCGLAGAPQ